MAGAVDPPDSPPAGCTTSGDGGTGLEPCPGCSSPRLRMEVESAALVLKNLFLTTFPPSRPPAPLPRLLHSLQPGQDGNFPVAVETWMKDTLQTKTPNKKWLCVCWTVLCHAGMRRLWGPSFGVPAWPGGLQGWQRLPASPKTLPPAASRGWGFPGKRL